MASPLPKFATIALRLKSVDNIEAMSYSAKLVAEGASDYFHSNFESGAKSRSGSDVIFKSGIALLKQLLWVRADHMKKGPWKNQAEFNFFY